MLGMSKANGAAERTDTAGRFARKPRHWAYAKAENPPHACAQATVEQDAASVEGGSTHHAQVLLQRNV